MASTCLAKQKQLEFSLARPIDGWDSYYVTPDGKVYRLKELKSTDNGNGYLEVKIMLSGKVFREYVHRLVAKAFCPNLDNHETVDHKDEDKYNNHFTNLSWMTLEDNIRKAFSKNYEAISPTGEVVKFTSIRKFCRENAIDSSALVKVIKGKINHTKGWRCQLVY